jgi:hypothetical protein
MMAKSSAVVAYLASVVAAFAAGFGAYHAILTIGGLQTVLTRRLDLLVQDSVALDSARKAYSVQHARFIQDSAQLARYLAQRAKVLGSRTADAIIEVRANNPMNNWVPVPSNVEGVPLQLAVDVPVNARKVEVDLEFSATSSRSRTWGCGLRYFKNGKELPFMQADLPGAGSTTFNCKQAMHLDPVTGGRYTFQMEVFTSDSGAIVLRPGRKLSVRVVE